MTDQYIKNAYKNIIPRSKSDDLKEAFKEWSFTNDVHDHEEAIADCELCEQRNLRYHFKIQNKYNNSSLWIGSNCILKFGVLVYDQHGQLLDKIGAEKRLEELTQKMQFDSCIKTLENLLQIEQKPILKDILSGAILYYRKKKALTPKQAYVVASRLREKQILHHLTFFKVCLRKKTHKENFQDMPTHNVHAIWPMLNSSQKEIARRMGHIPPQ